MNLMHCTDLPEIVMILLVQAAPAEGGGAHVGDGQGGGSQLIVLHIDQHHQDNQWGSHLSM